MLDSDSTELTEHKLQLLRPLGLGQFLAAAAAAGNEHRESIGNDAWESAAGGRLFAAHKCSGVSIPPKGGGDLCVKGPWGTER